MKYRLARCWRCILWLKVLTPVDSRNQEVTAMLLGRISAESDSKHSEKSRPQPCRNDRPELLPRVCWSQSVPNDFPRTEKIAAYAILISCDPFRLRPNLPPFTVHTKAEVTVGHTCAHMACMVFAAKCVMPHSPAHVAHIMASRPEGHTLSTVTFQKQCDSNSEWSWKCLCC